MVMLATAELRDRALGLASWIDPDTMTGAQAALVVEHLAVADKAIAGTLLFAALRVAKTDAWRGQGHASAADWLAARVGISVAEANRQLGTARRAERMPKTKDAIRKGGLSTDQAGAVTDGAAADPDAEDDLLATAANDTHRSLKDKAAKARAAATDAVERERRILARRSLRRRTDADGAFNLHLYGPGVDAAAFDALLKPFEELLFREGRREGRRDTYENRSYDAFFAMLAFLRAGPGNAEPAGEPPPPRSPSTSPPPAGERPDPEPSAPEGRPSAAEPGAPVPAASDAGAPATTPPDDRRTQPGEAGDPPGSPQRTWSPPWDPDRAVALPTALPGGNSVKVIVTVDHAALLRGRTRAGETCEIAGIGPISVAAARQILLDDPFLAVVVRKGRDVVNVAHHGRGLNVHQRTALEAAGGVRCSNIACNRTIAIEVDHRVPYGTDPVTALANQDPLCTHCHARKTHHGWHLEPGSGRRRFLPPGQRAPTRDDGEPEDPDAIEARLLARYPHVRPTRTPRGPAPERAEPSEQVEQPTLC
jgi:hypothetical protein